MHSKLEYYSPIIAALHAVHLETMDILHIFVFFFKFGRTIETFLYILSNNRFLSILKFRFESFALVEAYISKWHEKAAKWSYVVWPTSKKSKCSGFLYIQLHCRSGTPCACNMKKASVTSLSKWTIINQCTVKEWRWQQKDGVSKFLKNKWWRIDR